MKKTPLIPIDTRQIQNLLSYVESSMDGNVAKKIFEQLGAEHLSYPGFINWINKTKNDIKSYFEYINSGNDKYWEKLIYNKSESSISIIGKPVDRSACPYAQNDNLPMLLCNHCCIGFQKKMFEMLSEVAVKKIDINESFLFGGTRYSSTLHLNGEIKI